MVTLRREDKVGKWYFGGAAGCMAVCFTHPLDTLKVNLQTQQKVEYGLIGVGKKVIRDGGVLALYKGLSAAILRQATYTTTRFGIYEVVKSYKKDGGLTFFEKVSLAGMAGFCGGFVGTPADLVNVRMQNDIKLPLDKRRCYKNAIDGMLRVYREEGVKRMWGGGLSASTRGMAMNIGQLAFYEQFKQMLISTVYFDDNLTTHFTASTMAGSVATLMTMPLDVTKTRLMNAPPGTYSGIMACVADIGRNGPAGFFKGFLPAFLRLAPHTILTFVFLEQLRLRFGYYKDVQQSPV
ncbi:hypothetical protein GJ496_001837 [Pomphorhynchus laevis]|nr:hypothetical protein GJ496_001837 [Pomphorhynchus laevis]